MRLLFVHPSPHVTGAGRILALLTKYLRQRGHETLVVLPKDGPLARVHAEELGPALFVPMPMLRRAPTALVRFVLKSPKTISDLEELIRRWRPDIVHVHGVYTLWAGMAARRRRVPCLYHVHEDPGSYPGWLYRAWQQIVARTASRIVLVHPRLHKAWSAASPRLAVIENGVDVARIQEKAMSELSVRWRATWGGYTPTILCPSHIMPGKNQELLLRAAPAILRGLPDAGIVFLGRTHGVARNEAYLERLKHLAHRLGISERIRFTAEPEDAHCAYGAADLVVSTSPRESFGLIPLEGLAAGKPIVAVRAGIAESLEARGYAVRAVDPEDPQELAQAIIQMLTALRPAPTRSFPPEYRAEPMIERFEAMYAEILAECSAAPV